MSDPHLEPPIRVCERVALVNFGGTINMDGREGIHPGEGVADTLARLAIPVEVHHPFARPPDSTNVGPAEWAVLLRVLREIRDRKATAAELLAARGRPVRPAGIVVTHGTDTMAYTSLIAALTLDADLPFPVVFTGAWAPPGAPGSDARANLRKAIAVARADVPPAVYVLIGEDLHLPSRLVKVRTEPDAEGKYFISFPSPAGRVQGDDEITFHRDGLGVVSPPPPWTGSFGYVEHIVLDVATPVAVLISTRARMRRHLERRGLILQGNFRRHPDFDTVVEALAGLAGDGVLLFLGSREAVEAARATRPDLPVELLDKSLRHTTAWTKLTWLLGSTLDDDGVRVAMRTSLVGDVFTTHDLPHWTRYETFPPGGPGTAVVIVTPAMDPTRVADAAARLRAGGELHLYGFGHGHLPAPNRPIVDVVAEVEGMELPDCPTLTELVDAVARRLGDDARREALRARYTADPVASAALLRRRETESRLAAVRRRLWDELRSVGAALLNAEGAAWGPLEELEDLLSRRAPVRLDDATQRILGERQRVRARLSPDAAFDLLLAEAPDAVARRLIADAVRRASLVFETLGAARERGVNVRMRSLSVGAETDLTRYEVGTWLHVLGVDADRSRGWDWRGVRRR